MSERKYQFGKTMLYLPALAAAAALIAAKPIKREGEYLHMKSINPSGFDDEGGENYSSFKDEIDKSLEDGWFLSVVDAAKAQADLFKEAKAEPIDDEQTNAKISAALKENEQLSEENERLSKNVKALTGDVEDLEAEVEKLTKQLDEATKPEPEPSKKTASKSKKQ